MLSPASALPGLGADLWNSRGVQPKVRRNVLTKWLWSTHPTSSGTEQTLISVSNQQLRGVAHSAVADVLMRCQARRDPKLAREVPEGVRVVACRWRFMVDGSWF
jgi:hypothetical protein